MSEIVRTGVPSPATRAPGHECFTSGLFAGVAIAAGDACYIKGSDGTVNLADGTAADEKAIVAGYAMKAASIGEAVTLGRGFNLAYGPKIVTTPVSPGVPLYLSATVPGGLADAATTGGINPVAYVVDTDGRMFIKSDW